MRMIIITVITTTITYLEGKARGPFVIIIVKKASCSDFHFWFVIHFKSYTYFESHDNAWRRGPSPLRPLV